MRNTAFAVDDDDTTSFVLDRAAKASIGFLRSPNRTNVALSRAKHGLYIFGPSNLFASNSKMWEFVIDELREAIVLGLHFQPFVSVIRTNHSMSMVLVFLRNWHHREVARNRAYLCFNAGIAARFSVIRTILSSNSSSARCPAVILRRTSYAAMWLIPSRSLVRCLWTDDYLAANTLPK